MGNIAQSNIPHFKLEIGNSYRTVRASTFGFPAASSLSFR